MCEGKSHAAVVYRENSALKQLNRDKIKKEIQALTSDSEQHQVTSNFRRKFAEMTEQLVSHHHYVSQSEADRELLSLQLGSTREVQDENYYYGLAYVFIYAAILEALVFHGWSGSEESKKQLSKLHSNYLDTCKTHCDLVMLMAKARGEGRELTDSEKENGKSTILLKEATRRALAGEQVFDS